MRDKGMDYKEWDEIYKRREDIKEENPKLKNIKRSKTFKDEENTIRCAKCGSTQRISKCIDCEGEKEYLSSKEAVEML